MINKTEEEFMTEEDWREVNHEETATKNGMIFHRRILLFDKECKNDTWITEAIGGCDDTLHHVTGKPCSLKDFSHWRPMIKFPNGYTDNSYLNKKLDLSKKLKDLHCCLIENNALDFLNSNSAEWNCEMVFGSNWKHHQICAMQSGGAMEYIFKFLEEK